MFCENIPFLVGETLQKLSGRTIIWISKWNCYSVKAINL